MSGNSGAWGIVMWKDGREDVQEGGISLEGGDAVVPYLPTTPLGWLTAPPAGLGVPPVRSGDVAFAQRDGVVQFGDYYEPRILTFQVTICNDGCPGCPTGRQKVKRLTEEWSRNCDGATLAILSDCHDPDATQAEKVYLGPYLVHGRPRVADINWLPSDVGCADIVLRFDCEDAALRLAVQNEPGPGAEPWNWSHTADVEAGGDGGNMHPNYRLSGLTMTTNGGTFNDLEPSSGGPDGGSYFLRITVVPNVTSPMTMDTTPSGVDAIPVVAGQDYTLSWWVRKTLAGGPVTRVNMRWFDGAGATITTDQGDNMSASTDWERFTDNHLAPVGAEFGMPILAWSGTALDGQGLEFAQIWMNEGLVATGPAEVEVVGDLCVFPVITLSGPLTAPIVVNYGGNEFTYNEDIPALGAASVVVDTRWGRANTITVDTTQSLEGNYTTPLEPGTHDFSITTADPTDTGSARIEWYNAVVSG